MSILEKFRIPKFDGSDYVAYVIDRGEFEVYSLHTTNKTQTLYFCLCEEFRNSDIRIERIVNFNGHIKKTYNSDVVVEKIGDEYFVVKNRYGLNSYKTEKISATPIFE